MIVLPNDERERLHQVQGLITLRESDRLASLAVQAPAWSSIVEVGSHTGRSTVWLTAGSRAGERAHVTAIDPWPDPGYTGETDDPFNLGTGDAVLQRFIDNVTAEADWDLVTALRMTSLDAARLWVNPIGLLFLDAVHKFAEVKADCLAWLPHVTRGGVIALHDWFDDEPLSHRGGVAHGLQAAWNPEEWRELPMSDNLFVAVRL